MEKYFVIANVIESEGEVAALVVTNALETKEKAIEIGNRLTESFHEIRVVKLVEELGDGSTEAR